MSDLDARIRRIEDRAALEDLVVRYFVAADDDDLDGIAATFTTDGEFHVGDGFVGGSDRDSIVKFIAGERQNMGVTVHTPNYTLLDFVDDDHATGVVGAHLELARGGTTLFGAVRYLDDYLRTSGGWQIKRRRMMTIHIGPWDAVGDSLTREMRQHWPGQHPAPGDLPK